MLLVLILIKNSYLNRLFSTIMTQFVEGVFSLLKNIYFFRAEHLRDCLNHFYFCFYRCLDSYSLEDSFFQTFYQIIMNIQHTFCICIVEEVLKICKKQFNDLTVFIILQLREDFKYLFFIFPKENMNVSDILKNIVLEKTFRNKY